MSTGYLRKAFCKDDVHDNEGLPRKVGIIVNQAMDPGQPCNVNMQ